MFRFRKKRCKLVYRSEYIAGLRTHNSRQSFDVMKFKKIRDQLIKDHLIKRKDVLRAPFISTEDMLLIHTRDYLDQLQNPLIVGEILNMDSINPWDHYIFEYFRYIAGGTLLATEYAIGHNFTVFNLGGGFHHAHSDRGEGFCLINDVAIAVQKTLLGKKIERVLIIDLDYHQGNGNLLLFKNNENVFTFSMHANNWVAVEGKQNNIDIELPQGIEDELYLKILKSELSRVYKLFEPNLVVYIAGSDPYQDDVLGDFQISEEGMLNRDKLVYLTARYPKIPLVIVAGGGYGPASWKIYYNFIKWVIKKGK
jgi:acetoin utilization deacetylase AcuC-like enzyme